MAKVMARRCGACDEAVTIDVNDIKDVVYFKGTYYHKGCFEKLAREKAANKRCSKDWKIALDDGMRQIEADAKHMINYCYGRDLLYEHLLSNYDICSISAYCETTINKVLAGTYKGKSKPIPYRDFAECWVAMQPELDKIYANNKRLGKSMTGDQRINYDLAVVVRAYPQWKKGQEYNRCKAENRKISEQKEIKIDYSKIKITSASSGLGDISDLLDEII